ncbi:MAG TPA: hypothetical protein VEL31_12260 [Ktedonobacteraceae bacterium]|nr:hypothetical protein [Ktedonobacteraceae bacterium]
MAVVKNNYVKQDGYERKTAKAHIRYIQHRKGKEGAKATRDLFGRDGSMGRREAYRMIDDAGQESIFFRCVISPDGATEDTNRDLHLREVTEHMILRIEERFNQQIQWVGAVHDDHTDHRHVHLVAIFPCRLNRQDFQALPNLMRTAVTQACVEQRKERDLTREHQEQEREEEEWDRSY